MELTDRKKKVLRAIVELYIRTAEPVGSKTIAQLPDMDFSDLQECLVRNGDDELARALNMYRLSGESSVAEAAAFLDENANYIQRRMLNYVTRKIELFNM